MPSNVNLEGRPTIERARYYPALMGCQPGWLFRSRAARLSRGPAHSKKRHRAHSRRPLYFYKRRRGSSTKTTGPDQNGLYISHLKLPKNANTFGSTAKKKKQKKKKEKKTAPLLLHAPGVPWKEKTIPLPPAHSLGYPHEPRLGAPSNAERHRSPKLGSKPRKTMGFSSKGGTTSFVTQKPAPTK